MRRDDLGGYLAVISHRRPGNVAEMTRLVGPATWYVGAGESAAYLAAGAPGVAEAGGLCPSRNAALRDAWTRGLRCLQLSDDLRRVRFAEPGPAGKPVARDLAFADAVARLGAGLGRDGDRPRLAGAAPTANAFYFDPRRPVSADGFIVGDLIAVEPCGLFFDEALRLKEDYDYTLQHLERFGAVYRRNDVLAEFRHRTNPGGACDYRTAGREQQAIAHLKAKWPGAIRDNPRRPNEVLLRWRPAPCPSTGSAPSP